LFVAVVWAILAAEKKPAPVATITEMKGKVEIKRDGGWELIMPLQALFPGDVIRISPQGKAVISYLGVSTETMVEANSPYTVKEKMPGESRQKKLISKLTTIFDGLVHPEERKMVSLVTRSASAGRLLQPDNTLVLFPDEPVLFQWKGTEPSYFVSLYQIAGGNEHKLIDEKQVEGTSFTAPVATFQEGAIYRWTISSGAWKSGGMFQVLTKAETESVRSELKDILKEIPSENQVTRVLFEYGFLMDYGLVYDACKTIKAALAKYPDDETLKTIRLTGSAV
jgi:hypothetical protein